MKHLPYALNFIIIYSKYFPNSDWLEYAKSSSIWLWWIMTVCDQIWKNFVFNEEMTSKMQPATG